MTAFNLLATVTLVVTVLALKIKPVNRIKLCSE